MNEQDWRLLDADRSVEELRIDGWLLQKGDRVRPPAARPRRRLRPGAGGQDGRGRVDRAGPGGQLPRRRRARGGSRRLSRPAATAGPSVLLLARGGRAAAAGAARPAARRPAPSSSPGSATSSWATTDSAWRSPSGWRRGRCRPGSPSSTTASAGTTSRMRSCAARTTSSWWTHARGASRQAPSSCSSPTSPIWTRRTPAPAVLDAHDLNPVHVLRLARSLGAELGPVVVVGCEPATLGPPEGQMGLSEPVRGRGGGSSHPDRGPGRASPCTRTPDVSSTPH